MANRVNPYPQYRYLVDLKSGRDPSKPLGGFSEVTGIKTELHISEYRDGNDPANHVHKYSGMHTTADVTLKRGVVDTSDLWSWIVAARKNGASAQRDVTITLQDEAGNSVEVFKLHRVTPKGYTSPALNGKGTGDMAIEELVLAPETVEVSQVG
ncbi:MAG: phage tail protein [Terracidiphilus sp.]|jgi:phage tail-like protein